MKDNYDVVVIGSGFGGAVTGCRQAQAGRSVCILEQGRRWLPHEFPRSFQQFGRSFWDGSADSGFLEYNAYEGMDVMVGIGVGGGSLHYFGVTIPASPRIFEQKVWPKQITRGVLDPYYDVVKGMLDAAPIPSTPSFPLPHRAQAILGAAKAAGYPSELVDLAIYVDADGKTRRNPHSGIDQASCDYNSNCLLGCRVNAKNSLDVNYLPLAERHGAEIHPLHQVEKIEPLPGGGFRVHATRLDADHPEKSRSVTVDAGKVVVSAGTLGSAQLLLRCRDVHKTLPEIGNTLGTRYSGNGDFAYAATWECDPDVDMSQGPLITSGFHASTDDNVIFIEDVGIPNPISWLLTGLLVEIKDASELMTMMKDYLDISLASGESTEGGVKNILAKVEKFVDEKLGIEDSTENEIYKIGRAFKKIFADPPFSHVLPYLGMGTDAANGTLRLDGEGKVVLDWDPAESEKMYDQMQEALKKVTHELGGKYTPCPVWVWPLRKTISAHPLGGCFMGDDSASSVVDPYGRVWQYPGLYVIDGSMIPTALAVNPSMTIAALAERSNFHMLHGREMEAGDPYAPTHR